MHNLNRRKKQKRGLLLKFSKICPKVNCHQMGEFGRKFAQSGHLPGGQRLIPDRNFVQKNCCIPFRIDDSKVALF
jgi:hypothetical protein